MTHVASAELTIADLNDGLNAYLTQDACLIVTAEDGTGGNYTIANTTMVIRQGTADVSSYWTVTATPSAGVTGALSTRTYSVSAMSVDSGYVDLTASKTGETPITLRFTIAKAKQGVTGERGTITTSKDISPASSWDNAQANTAISDAGGGSPRAGDVVTLYNNAANWSQTRVRTTGGSWALLAAFFGGDVLVDGTVVADKLAADSVIANKIAAGAIGAIHLQAGSILASKLTIADFTNLIPGSEMTEAAAWTIPTNFTLNANAAGSPFNSPGRIQWTYTSGAGWIGAVISQRFPVEAGASYLFHVQTFAEAGITYQLPVRIYWYNAAGEALTTPNNYTSVSMGIGTGFATKQQVIVPPTDAKFGEVRVWGSRDNSNGNASFGGLYLRRMASGELIVDGAVVASKIAAGAVSADKIQAGSILASKLAISDFSNIVPDGEMADPAAWTLPTGWSRNPGATSFGFESPNSLMFTDDGVSTGYSGYAASKLFPVETGKPYYFRYQTWAASGITYRVYGRIHWYDATKTALTTTPMTNIDLTDVTSTGVMVTRALRIDPPANAKFAEIRFYVERGITTGNVQVGGVSCRRMASGELIVDGSIQAVHVGTNEIVANTANIKDGIITNAKIVELSAAKLIAGTALASTITVNGTTLDLVEGRAADPAAQINIANTKIDPGKITITGGTTLADWRKGGDETKIDGGAISANTIATNKLTVGNRGFTVTAVTFDYDATTNTVSWSGGFVRWVNDAGVTTNTSIAAGSAVWSSGVLYICFDKTGVLKALNIAAAFGENVAILATYQGGKNLIVDYGKTIIDGGMVKTGTLKADSVDTSSFSTAGLAVFGDSLQSTDFSAGTAGWRIQKNGTAEFGTLALREGAVSSVYGAEQEAEINTQATWLTICSLTFTPSTNRQLLVMYSALLRCNPSFSGGDDIQTVFDAVNYRIVWRGSAARSRTLSLPRTIAFAQRGQHINDIMLVSPGGLTSGTLEFQFQRGSADANRAYASQATLVAQELKR